MRHPTAENSSAARAETGRVKPRKIRRATFSVLITGSTFAALGLAYQLADLGSGAAGDLGGFAKLLLLFLSPYAALAILTLICGRERLEASITLTGAAVITLWGVYWHLDIFVLRPDVVSQLLSPLLIVGNQWLAVVATASLALVVRMARGVLGRRA